MTTTFAASRSADYEASPWLDEGGFPADGNDDWKLAWLVRRAVLASSGHNTQPWIFRIEDGTLELYADRTRALPAVDPDNRELTISCGAALFHLWLALRHHGYAGDIDLQPQFGNVDLLAQVRLGERRAPTAEEELLFAQLRMRHTHRGPFDQRPLPSQLIVALQAAAAEEGAWLHVLDREKVGNRAADLVAEGDRAAGSPVLAVLGTDEDDTLAWLEAGEALAHVLLRACRDGVWASFLNQPIEVPALRSELRQLVGRPGYPQMLLRLGFSDTEPRPTPRRGAAEVVWMQ